MRPLSTPSRTSNTLPQNGLVSVARACEVLNLSGVGYMAHVRSGKLTPRRVPTIPDGEFIDVVEIRAILDARPPAYLRNPRRR